MKRHKLGAPGDRHYGYTEYKGGDSVPSWPSGNWALTNGQGSVIGQGRQINCSRIKPGAAGHWISSTRCSYQFKLASTGEPVACRSYGHGMAASCRVMKKAPRGLAGFWPFKKKKPKARPGSKTIYWTPGPGHGSPMSKRGSGMLGRARRRRR